MLHLLRGARREPPTSPSPSSSQPRLRAALAAAALFCTLRTSAGQSGYDAFGEVGWEEAGLAGSAMAYAPAVDGAGAAPSPLPSCVRPSMAGQIRGFAVLPDDVQGRGTVTYGDRRYSVSVGFTSVSLPLQNAKTLAFCALAPPRELGRTTWSISGTSNVFGRTCLLFDRSGSTLVVSYDPDDPSQCAAAPAPGSVRASFVITGFSLRPGDAAASISLAFLLVGVSGLLATVFR